MCGMQRGLQVLNSRGEGENSECRDVKKSLVGELQDCTKHEAREANAERVGFYARNRRLYIIELYIQNYMLEKAFWLWRE